MKGSTILLRRLWRPVLSLAAPGIVVILALWILEFLNFRAALVATILTLVGTGFVVRLLLSDIGALRDYAIALSENSEVRHPHLVFADTLIQILAAIRRLSRTQDDRATVVQNEEKLSGLDYLPDPVLMLNSNREIVRDNIAARDLLGGELAGRNLAAVLRNPSVLDAVDSLLAGEAETAEIEFDFQVPVLRYFRVRMAGVPPMENQPIAVVIALHDVTEMKRADDMRSDFVANASHELRTPLSVLLGCLQTLSGSARDDPEAQAEFVGMMEGHAERMARLVDDLLSLSRIEMNEHAVPDDIVDMGQIVLRTIGALKPKADAQGIAIKSDFDNAQSMEVQGDEEDLQMALQNLIDNALKYGGEASAVTVSARPATEDQLSQLPRDESYLAISVRDQGEGIAAEHLPRLTERFYRVDSARSRQLGGTGLGLAIVKHVVNRHRGHLHVSSVLGEGSVFTIVLPLAEEVPDASLTLVHAAPSPVSTEG
jgi:two-component system phosphate regulon sensor histidine kinase PhoR